MKKNEQFENFLQSLRTEDNAGLIESITNGFKAIHEAGGYPFNLDSDEDADEWEPADEEDFDGVTASDIRGLEDSLDDEYEYIEEDDGEDPRRREVRELFAD